MDHTRSVTPTHSPVFECHPLSFSWSVGLVCALDSVTGTLQWHHTLTRRGSKNPKHTLSVLWADQELNHCLILSTVSVASSHVAGLCLHFSHGRPLEGPHPLWVASVGKILHSSRKWSPWVALFLLTAQRPTNFKDQLGVLHREVHGWTPPTPDGLTQDSHGWVWESVL